MVVKISFEMPEYTANVDGVGVLRLLEAIRSSGYMEKCKFYQASTSELYGLVQEVPQKESTPFYPGLHMEWLNYMVIGLQKIIEKHIICLHVMVYCLIMKALDADQHLLQEKLPED